jgi:hypothetical protein
MWTSREEHEPPYTFFTCDSSSSRITNTFSSDVITDSPRAFTVIETAIAMATNWTTYSNDNNTYIAKKIYILLNRMNKNLFTVFPSVRSNTM